MQIKCFSCILASFHKPIYITFKLLDTFIFLIFIKDKTSCGIVIWEKWKKMAKYGKYGKIANKICNCNKHVTKCDKNIKTPKSSLEFQFEALPHDEDKKV